MDVGLCLVSINVRDFLIQETSKVGWRFEESAFVYVKFAKENTFVKKMVIFFHGQNTL